MRNYKTINLSQMEVEDLEDVELVRFIARINNVNNCVPERGNPMALATATHRDCSIEIILFPDVYRKHHSLLDVEKDVFISGELHPVEN